jgi:hypothetical protein
MQTEQIRNIRTLIKKDREGGDFALGWSAFSKKVGTE